MSKNERGRLPAIHCPHCGGRSIVRTSVAVTELVRELRLNCTNDDCGHSFVSQLSVVRTIRQSARPNPAIRLPFGTPRTPPANDDVPEPANDCGPAPAPARSMTG